MARVLTFAHRLYSNAEATVASFAEANIPYAAQALLLLQILDLVVARISVGTVGYIEASAWMKFRGGPALKESAEMLRGRLN